MKVVSQKNIVLLSDSMQNYYDDNGNLVVVNIVNPQLRQEWLEQEIRNRLNEKQQILVIKEERSNG